MSAPAVAAPKKTKVAKAKTAASHPTYSAMIKAAIKNLKDRQGSSKQAIFKYILTNYKVGSNAVQINSHLRQALKRGVTKGLFTQPKGIGANGRFRLSESAKAKAAAKPKTTKKPKTKKAAKPAGEKKASPKKKTPKAKTAKKAKSPKKAAGPKKTKSPKKAKSPKKPKTTKPKVAKKASKPKAPKKAAAPAATA